MIRSVGFYWIRIRWRPDMDTETIVAEWDGDDWKLAGTDHGISTNQLLWAAVVPLTPPIDAP